MALVPKLLQTHPKLHTWSSFKRSFTVGRPICKKRSCERRGNRAFKMNVPGLSNAVVDVPHEPVGPGASKECHSEYKNPEYFSFHKYSYFEAEVEMLKYRCPQPSPFKKYNDP